MGLFYNDRSLYLLSNYKYVAGGETFIDSYLQIWWRYAVNLLPTWMAPNLVSLKRYLMMSHSYLAGYIIGTTFYDSLYYMYAVSKSQFNWGRD